MSSSRGGVRAAALGLLAVGVVAAAAPAAAQDWRTVSHRRRVAGEERMAVQVRFGAGELRVVPAEPGTLYRSSLRYDARIFEPIHEYAAGELRLGIEGAHDGMRVNIREGSRMDVALGPDVPLELDLEFGAVEAEIELGGLRISRADVSTGASETRLRFSKPNPVRMSRFQLEAGAAAFRAEGLGNANVESLRVSGGVGDLTLDFTGDWRHDMDVDIDMGLGSLTLRIPRDVAVVVTKETFLMAFDSQGLVKRGDAYYSTNADTASHRMTLSISGALGSVDVRWVGSPNDAGR